MSWLDEELSGWPIGSGYYSTSVGTDEARDMASAIKKALLGDDVIERAARALYEEDREPDAGDEPWDDLYPDLRDYYVGNARAALEAAIEGDER